MGKKEKKEKIVYIDDGSTVADMSNVQGSRFSRDPMKPRSTLKEQWQTYIAAVKMMFGPMLVMCCGLVIIFLVIWLVFLLMK